jgi:hypothetical protein
VARRERSPGSALALPAQAELAFICDGCFSILAVGLLGQ